MSLPKPMTPEELKAREAKMDLVSAKMMDLITAEQCTVSETLFLFSHLAAVQLAFYEKIETKKWLNMFDNHASTQRGRRHQVTLAQQQAAKNGGGVKNPDMAVVQRGTSSAPSNGTMRTPEENAEHDRRLELAARNEQIEGAHDDTAGNDDEG